MDGVNDEGQTALQAAAGQARSQDRVQAKVIALLLDRGAKAEVADKNGMTPLMRASAFENRGGVVELLLKHGARMDSVNKNNQTPLFFAVVNKNTATAAILRSRGAH